MTFTPPRSWLNPELPMGEADPVSLVKALKPKLAPKLPVTKEGDRISNPNLSGLIAH